MFRPTTLVMDDYWSNSVELCVLTAYFEVYNNQISNSLEAIRVYFENYNNYLIDRMELLSSRGDLRPKLDFVYDILNKNRGREFPIEQTLLVNYMNYYKEFLFFKYAAYSVFYLDTDIVSISEYWEFAKAINLGVNISSRNLMFWSTILDAFILNIIIDL